VRLDCRAHPEQEAAVSIHSLIRDRLASFSRALPVKGRWRVAPALNRLFPTGPADAHLPGVGRVRLDLRHEDQSQVYWAGLSRDNSDMLAALCAALPPGGAFLDVGANIGLHTLAVAHHLESRGGRVLAFEPHPENYRALRDNIQRNALRNVTAENVGLADFPDVITGTSAPGPGNWSLASKGECRFEVRLVRLDDYLDQHPLPSVDAMKIDVEGAEVRVLRGARATIERSRPVIVFEVCPMWLARMGTSVDELFDMVQAPGYTIHPVPMAGRGWGSPVRLEDIRRLPSGGWTNLVAVPKRA
jgi:FkbM family methyltransferase